MEKSEDLFHRLRGRRNIDPAGLIADMHHVPAPFSMKIASKRPTRAVVNNRLQEYGPGLAGHRHWRKSWAIGGEIWAGTDHPTQHTAHELLYEWLTSLSTSPQTSLCKEASRPGLKTPDCRYPCQVLARNASTSLSMREDIARPHWIMRVIMRIGAHMEPLATDTTLCGINWRTLHDRARPQCKLSNATRYKSGTT